MTTKDLIVIIISACALTLSLFSLIITLIQKSKETKRTIRKTLTDTLEGVSKINVEASKLKAANDIDFSSESMISLRRNFNSQRRILLAHADFLVQRYDELTTDIDFNILAGAYATIGDYEKAEVYWKKTIEKSFSLAMKHMNMRGFGIFLFKIGKQDLGREIFNEALKLELLDNDENKILRIDTCLMLADSEKEYDAKENYDAILIEAMTIWATIKNGHKKAEMFEVIASKQKN